MPADNTAVKKDNTAVNKGDRTAGAPTADQQSNGKSDLEMTRQIRRAIVGDKSLSTYAHNVKIVTQHGGAITAANRREGGACLEVWLPAPR